MYYFVTDSFIQLMKNKPPVIGNEVTFKYFIWIKSYCI